MSRDYRISFYFADEDNYFENWTKKEVELYLADIISEGSKKIHPNKLKAFRSNYYHWDKNVPENNHSLPEEIWEERFLE